LNQLQREKDHDLFQNIIHPHCTTIQNPSISVAKYFSESFLKQTLSTEKSFQTKPINYRIRYFLNLYVPSAEYFPNQNSPLQNPYQIKPVKMQNPSQNKPVQNAKYFQNPACPNAEHFKKLAEYFPNPAPKKPFQTHSIKWQNISATEPVLLKNVPASSQNAERAFFITILRHAENVKTRLNYSKPKHVHVFHKRSYPEQTIWAGIH
jgi:hypothetical protein